jgi:thioester reductase-like protein
VACLNQSGATVGYLPEAAWSVLLGAGWAPPAGFRAVLPAEPAPALRDGLLDRGVRVLVSLALTGGGAWYGFGEFTGDDDRRLATVALPNLGLEVRGADGAPALPGAVGELVLTGRASPRPAGYCTGDLVRAGTAPVVRGRTDGSVIRAGQAAHPSIVDAALGEFAGVAERAVIVRPAGLVAFCTPSTVDTRAAVATLGAQLPEPFRPALVVAVAELPRLPTGELDRGALARLADQIGNGGGDVGGGGGDVGGGDVGGGDEGGAGTAGNEPPRTDLERALLASFRQSLERDDLGIRDDFFASGGTSLAAARLSGALAEAVGAPVPLRTLFRHPTVAGLAAALATVDGDPEAVTALQEAARDSVLPPEIEPSGPGREGPPRHAFVTGATGFLGSHLVAELLDRGLDRVTCLVRGADEAEAGRRLRGALERFRVAVPLDRVQVVAGDLDAIRFGLSEERFTALADAVDVIYHSGGQTNFAVPYRTLRGPNVLGTQEVLRLACQGRVTPVHHISTFDARVGDHLVEEPTPIDAGSDDGYSLSKKVAEHLVLAAGARGLPVGVYRPWTVTAATRSGAVNPHDQLTLCLIGTLLTRMAPADPPFPLRVLPADAVARIVVGLSAATDQKHPIHHLYNPETVHIGRIWDQLQALGYPLTVVPFEQWRVQLARRTAGKVDGLEALLAASTDAPTAQRVVDTTNTARRLGATPVWPELDADYLGHVVAYLVDHGVVPAAGAGPEVT